jgi:Thrombospondin type 1 domain/Calcium-binding EGF domain
MPTRKRYRTCDNPLPSYGGLHCIGSEFEEKECTLLKECPVHGNWSAWSEWSSCSKTCGRNAHRVRTRTCTNPAPKSNGRPCEGENIEYEECKLKACSNYNLKRTLEQRGRASDSTERYGELAELEIRNNAGEPRVFQFMQHREVEYFSPPPSNLINGQKMPRIKVTLDTYRPISEETYKKHMEHVTSDELDDYFESSYDDSIELSRSTSTKSCALGFKFNSEKNHCEEINECQYAELNSCRREEVCVNTIGSYRCLKK